MSSHLTEPGELIEQTVASAFSSVPEVPVSKRAVLRSARLGKPEPAADGALPLLASLTNSLRAWKVWKDDYSSPPTSLKDSFQMGHRRRKLQLITMVEQPDGTFVPGSFFSAGPGYSSSQNTRWWQQAVDLSSSQRRFTTYVRYPGNEQISGTLTGVAIDVVAGTATISAISLGAAPGMLEFTVNNPDNYPEVVIRIQATESREYGPTGSYAAPVKLDVTVVAKMT
jgi:hypothetical protein